MAELLEAMEDRIGSLKLVPSAGGKFEVTVNGKLAYSKLQTGRHPNDGEVAKRIRQLESGKG